MTKAIQASVLHGIKDLRIVSIRLQIHFLNMALICIRNLEIYHPPARLNFRFVLLRLDYAVPICIITRISAMVTFSYVSLFH